MKLLDFYQQHGISPVRQDITDLPAHFARRAALYRQLGLIRLTVEGRSVLEIGPGSGENALYTASLKPGRYVLLEPNLAGALALRSRNPETMGGGERWEILETTIENYRGGLFDIVLCEGVLGLAGGNAPEILEAAVSHVKPGGVLVITCIDAISDHAEILRRAMAQRLIKRGATIAENLEILRPIFAPHLATLKGMTRSVDDWIVDNLLNPASIGPTFSIPEACEALEGRFEVMGCSPRFLLDWRWYKDSRPGNGWAVEAYWLQAHNLQDYRYIAPPKSRLQNEALARGAALFRGEIAAFEAGTGGLPFISDIEPGWFGRGQQYLSFVRV